jgi:hypothetical protein
MNDKNLTINDKENFLNMFEATISNDEYEKFGKSINNEVDNKANPNYLIDDDIDGIDGLNKKEMLNQMMVRAKRSINADSLFDEYALGEYSDKSNGDWYKLIDSIETGRRANGNETKEKKCVW